MFGARAGLSTDNSYRPDTERSIVSWNKYNSIYVTSLRRYATTNYGLIGFQKQHWFSELLFMAFNKCDFNYTRGMVNAKHSGYQFTIALEKLRTHFLGKNVLKFMDQYGCVDTQQICS